MNLLLTWLSDPLLLELDSDVNASIDERDDSVSTTLSILLLYFMGRPWEMLLNGISVTSIRRNELMTQQYVSRVVAKLQVEVINRPDNKGAFKRPSCDRSSSLMESLKEVEVEVR